MSADRRTIRGALGALAVLGVLVGWAGEAGAAGPIRPRMECLWPQLDGTMLVLWGYENIASAPVEYQVGGQNKVKPKPFDQGQPTVFEPGVNRGVFVSEHSQDEAIEWQVHGRKATADLDDDPMICATQPLPTGGGSLSRLVVPTAFGAVGLGVLAAATNRSSAKKSSVADKEEELV